MSVFDDIADAEGVMCVEIAANVADAAVVVAYDG